MRPATAQDRELAAAARARDALRIKWPEKKALTRWAKAQGWPGSWFDYQGAFEKKMLESDALFALALAESGIEVQVPKERYAYPDAELKELDELYDERGDTGRPTSWGLLVAGLRDIRRAVEAGVVVEVDGHRLTSFSSFYSWAHGRYHMLEDGYDSWIGDDET
jgi:hypothetical protein